MKRFFIVAALSLSIAACSVDPNANSSVNATSVVDQIQLKSTTALSLAELAFNSAEASATAALLAKKPDGSPVLSKADATKLGGFVHSARAYRNQARVIVAGGGDAASVIETLNSVLANINAIVGK